MSEFEPISLKPKNDQAGLVWSGHAADRYLIELQTGIIPQLVHLVFFDSEADHAVVHTQVEAFEVGDVLDAAAMEKLEGAISDVLANLGS